MSDDGNGEMRPPTRIMKPSQLLLGISLVVAACTGEHVTIGSDEQVAPEAGTDAGLDHATPDAPSLIDAMQEPDAGWPEPFGACGDAIESACPPPSEPARKPKAMFDTAVLGPGHRIIDTDGRFVWIDREQAGVHDTLLVTLWSYLGDAGYETHTLDSSEPLQPLAAAGRLVLACNATACSLYSWQNDKATRLEGDELVRSTNPIAIATGQDVIYGLGSGVYALGDGVYRFSSSGTWTTEIEPDEGVKWRAISANRYLGGETVVVVGDNGLVRLKSGDLAWKAVDVGTNAPLRAVSVSHESILIGATDGTLIRVEGGLVKSCSTGQGITSIDHNEDFLSYQAVGSTADGQGFEYRSSGEACHPEAPAGVVRARLFICGIASNAVYQTDSVVWGTDFCAVD